MSKKLIVFLALMLALSLFLVSCGGLRSDGDNLTQTPVVGGATKLPTTAAASNGPRVGGWVDTIALSVVRSDSAISLIENGTIDIYGSNLSTPQELAEITDAGLDHSSQYGIFYDLALNPVGDPTFVNAPNTLNPFSSARVREAMNWLIDRDYLNQVVFGGNAVPKYVSFISGFPEYGRYIDLIRPYEVYYAPSQALAAKVIGEEMSAMGARLITGTWFYNDEPVVIKFLIRTDADGTRRFMGDIISVWLEEVGFEVERIYGSSTELSAITSGDTEDGEWHIYTNAFSATSVSRDDTYDFELFYSPRSKFGGSSLWQAYDDMSAEELNVFTALTNKYYFSPGERRALIAEALEVAFKYSYRVWLLDVRGVSPWRPDLTVSYDLAAGVDVNALYPYTLRYEDSVGGLVRMGEPDLFIDPPNPVRGSNWTYDNVWQGPTSDYDAITNPYTGLPLPQRLERAEVTVQYGLPVSQTYDWVSLEFSDQIVPPDDAWVSWDVDSETFLTVADWKETVEVVGRIRNEVTDLADELDVANLDVDGTAGFVYTTAAIYTEQSGEQIDVSEQIAEAQIVPVLNESLEDQDLRSLMEIRLAGIQNLATPEERSAGLAAYGLEFLQVADQAGLFSFASRDFSYALKKVVYYYPEELWDITWHDGSPLTIADFVMPMIMQFATGTPGSPLYDRVSAQNLVSSLAGFKGERIVSVDPLVIELYSDVWYEDAEYNAVRDRTVFWPDYGYGQSGWAMVAVANRAEENMQLAYSSDKANANGIGWMSWLSGPSLGILAENLDDAMAQGYIPFEATMSQFVTPEEAAERYENLKTFSQQYGHFWVGTGPYILTEVNLEEESAVLSHNANYIDPAGKWDQFAEPKVAVATLESPGNVYIGVD
ncbi:MAG TPA: ABC transporter substrate-binding protein, partial [Anaerolineales bacterium]|nr:ABC transporter substrate-binding protein [Anaerolineales bacterium]